MTFSERLHDGAKAARHSDAWCNYLHVREKVIQMMDETPSPDDHRPSDYWTEELSGIDYMFDASPSVIVKLRQHCHHLTGIRAYDYRTHHSHQIERFATKLHMLRRHDERGLLLPEAPALGGFGHTVDGSLYNLDTLKFYECLIGMDKAGILDALARAPHGRRLVMEIGAGWGGFAWQFKTHFPGTTYVIVDLPPVLLFSAVYLKTLFPLASVFIYGDQPLKELMENPAAYDFIFLPHFLIPALTLKDIDLMINLVSFQEMTSAQVELYVKYAAQSNCRHIYSLNRNRSRHNTQLGNVASIIGDYYHARQIRVLDMAYADLPSAADRNAYSASRLGHSLKGLIKRRAGNAAGRTYRHIAGTLPSTARRKAAL